MDIVVQILHIILTNVVHNTCDYLLEFIIPTPNAAWKAMRDLEGKWEVVKRKVEFRRKQGRQPFKPVETWIDDVKSLQETMKKLEDFKGPKIWKRLKQMKHLVEAEHLNEMGDKFMLGQVAIKLCDEVAILSSRDPVSSHGPAAASSHDRVMQGSQAIAHAVKHRQEAQDLYINGEIQGSIGSKNAEGSTGVENTEWCSGSEDFERPIVWKDTGIEIQDISAGPVIELEELRKQRDELSGELQKANEQKDELEQLRKQRDELFEELQKANVRKDELEQPRKQRDELFEELQKANEQKIELAQLKKQHDELFGELQKANEQKIEFEQLRKQRDEIYGELQKVNEQKIELERIRTEHDKLFGELRKANEIELEQLRKQCDEVSRELQEAKEQKIEFEQLKRQHVELFGELQKVNQQKIALEQLKKQRDELFGQLQETNEQKIEFEQLKKQRDELYVDLQRANDQLCRENALRECERVTTGTHKIVNFSRFSYSELQQATRNFHESSKIGEGGYGGVYKGFLRHTVVAIKKLNPQSMQGEAAFNQEVDVLSRVRHPNLVTLIGACPEAWSLVYEFLPNGSLEDRLTCKDGKQPLSWQARTRIANEICSVLVFLHSHQPEIVVHGDLKPANILLDANCVSKLGDFGICRLLARSNSTTSAIFHQTLQPKGTLRYLDPVFLNTGELTTHSDVYAFGIILLRHLTGRPPGNIAKEVQAAIEKVQLHRILDASAGNWPVKESLQLAKLALRCCDLERKKRPDLASDAWKVLKAMMKATTTMGSSSSFM